MAYELPAYGEENWHLKLDASLNDLHETRAVVVHYDAGWPSRPTAETVIWVGGTPNTPPTEGVTGADLWYVPNV